MMRHCRRHLTLICILTLRFKIRLQRIEAKSRILQLCSMGAIEDNEEYQRLKNDPKFMNSPAVANPSAISPKAMSSEHLFRLNSLISIFMINKWPSGLLHARCPSKQVSDWEFCLWMHSICLAWKFLYFACLICFTVGVLCLLEGQPR